MCGQNIGKDTEWNENKPDHNIIHAKTVWQFDTIERRALVNPQMSGAAFKNANF